VSEIERNNLSRSSNQSTEPANLLEDNFKRLQEAERLRQQGQYDRAQAICETLVRAHPDYMGALHTLGLVFADQHKFEEALDCLVRAAMLNPRSWATLVALAGVYLRFGANEMAAETLAQAAKIEPRNPHVLIGLGDLYREEREYELARDAYGQAIALDPSSVSAAIGLGWCHENLGAHADAAAVFEGLIKRGMRLLEPIRALANLPASVVNVDLLSALDKVVRDPSEDKRDFENSVPFFKAVAFDRVGRHAEAWKELVAANRAVFVTLQKYLPELSTLRRASLASLRAHPRKGGRARAKSQPTSLFILGPSASGKTTMEKLVAALPNVKGGYENPIVENAVRRTFQTSNLLTVSLLKHLPPQLFPLCREIYLGELARRAGSARVFTNTLSTSIHDAARMVSVFPNVRFIFLKRNMYDNLLRIFMRKYRAGNAYGYNLKAAREYILWYHQMIDLMAEKFPDIVRVINYEDMIASPAAALSVVAELCDLPISDEVLPPTVASDCGCATPYRQFIAAGLES
jgi:Flp pilus assembly protein TadD